MKAMTTWELNNGIRINKVLSKRINAYLIESKSHNFLVDTGVYRNRNKLNVNVKTTGHSSIHTLILTHSHFDHCANAAYIQRKYNCELIIGMAEAHYTENGFTALPRGTNGWTRFVYWFGNYMGKKVGSYEPFTADKHISKMYEFLMEECCIHIIPTPGHSPGSVSVIINNEIALVGDTLFGVFKHTVFPPFADDIPEMLQSWKKLLDTGCYLFLPGHGKEIGRELLQSEYNKLYVKKVKRSF